MINYTYSINLTIIDIDHTVHDYSKRISFLTILDDYNNGINSAIKIGFFVTAEMYNKLCLRATDMTYSLTVTADHVNHRQNDPTSIKEYFLNSFKIKPVTVPQTIYKTEGSSNSNKSDYIQVVMDFVPSILLNYNRYLCNGIYKDVTVNDVILYLLNKMSVPVIYERPHNLTKYSQIVLPPNNLFMSFKFLQQHYGIYNNGLSMWFLGNNFCFKNRYNSNDTPRFDDSHVNSVRIFVNKNTNENKGLYGEGTTYDPHKNIYNYETTVDKLFVDNNIITMEELYGNEHMTYSRNLEGTYVTDTELNFKANKDKMKLYFNGIENPTVVKQYFNELCNPVTFSLDYNTANLNMWNPLNRFRLQVKTQDIVFDKYINKIFQVMKNEMFFKVSAGQVSLQGKVKLVEIGGVINVD